MGEYLLGSSSLSLFKVNNNQKLITSTEVGVERTLLTHLVVVIDELALTDAEGEPGEESEGQAGASSVPDR